LSILQHVRPIGDSEQSIPSSEDDVKSRMEKASTLDAEIMTAIRAAFDPSDKLERQVALGNAFVERAWFQKENTSDWNRVAYSHLASQREDEAKLTLGINNVRLDVSAKIYGFVEAVKVSNPLVEKVSYYRIANHFIPMFAWDCVRLEGQIKPEWLSFVRDIIDDNAETKDRKPMPIKELTGLIEAEKERRKRAEASKPNDAAWNALKQATKSATREKNAKIKRRNETREKLNQALADAVKYGDFTAGDLANHIATTTLACGIDLPLSTAYRPFNPKSLDIKGAVELMQVLYAAGKMAEINAIVNAGQKMVQVMLDTARVAS
jgi:hypothetical protein